MALPITASAIRCCASPPMVAPRSSITESPRAVGQIAAIAGRSMPGSMRRQNRAIAISAPVLPAETATSASPFLTASIASHIDEVLRPRRSAWLGLSCMLTATSVWMTRETAFSAGCLASCGVDQRAIAEQQKFSVGMSGQRNGGAGNDDRCADIATHGVKRDSNLLRHERPGNLILCGLEALGRGLEIATDSGDRRSATLRPGRAATIACPRPDTTS